MTDSRTRRQFLILTGITCGVAVSGCLEDNDDMNDGSEDGSMDDDGMTDDGDTDPMEDDTAEDETTTETASTNDDGEGTEESIDTNLLEHHPVGRELSDRPRLGPDPFAAPATLVVLDDPSCPTCATFHDQTVTELEATHVESGDLSIVYRPYPVVYDWGPAAAHSLEAVYDRDEDVFWELLRHYFAEQRTFNTDNVLDRTENWVDSNTALDATAVIEDARNEVFADRIQTTLDAGEEVGAGGYTPASFPFKEGEYQTTLNGSASTATIETILGL